MIEQLELTDFLSYGAGTTRLDLRPLNVLIGPNGSGKSNLVEALAVLRAVPRDLPAPIRRGGGVAEWIWRGSGRRPEQATLAVDLTGRRVTATGPDLSPVRYRLTFGAEGGAFLVLDEQIDRDEGGAVPRLFFGYPGGQPTLASQGGPRTLDRSLLDRAQSVLSQRRDPEAFPELSRVGELLGGILIYRSWSFGPESALRASCLPDVPTAVLAEDFSNLPARLAVLKRNPATKRRLLDHLAELAPGFSDVEVVPEGGRLQLYLTDGERSVPAHRLSDGTLRYLALLAILLDPGAATLVVLEEPELGLHPDVLPSVRDLLIEASERTQIVATTHSSQLLDALTDHAATVVVCERQGEVTTVSRLVQADIDELRPFGLLGTLWMSGRLGGTRW